MLMKSYVCSWHKDKDRNNESLYKLLFINAIYFLDIHLYIN